eukprot:scaffold216_cov375-Pavlova_lutheri.AAC.6
MYFWKSHACGQLLIHVLSRVVFWNRLNGSLSTLAYLSEGWQLDSMKRSVCGSRGERSSPFSEIFPRPLETTGEDTPHMIAIVHDKTTLWSADESPRDVCPSGAHPCLGCNSYLTWPTIHAQSLAVA